MANVKKQKTQMDMINGPMVKNIFIFSIPIILTTILQHFFHSADMAVIGNFCGKNELAAIGSTANLTSLLTSMVIGYSTGASIVISHLLGAKKQEDVKRAVHNTVFLAIVSGLFLMVFGILTTNTLLRFTKTPEDIFPLASLYMKIYFLGSPFIMVYNFTAIILRSKGETKKPLVCLISGGIANVILNLILVTQFNMGVAGVGIATVVSNIISCILTFRLLLNEKDEFKLDFKAIKPDKKIISEIVKLGFPIGIQNILFPLSNTLFQSGINSLGTLVIAGNSAAGSIESFSQAVVNGFAQANIAFVGQNFGAKNIKKCQEATYKCMGIAFITSTMFNILIYAFYNPICKLFINDYNVVFYAKQRTQILFLSQFANVFMGNVSNSLRGMKKSAITSYISIFGICGIRILWRYTIFEITRSYRVLMFGFGISWLITGIVLLFIYFDTVKKCKVEFANDGGN